MPPGVTLGHIYHGIVPIVLAEIVSIALLLAPPGIATWLPGQVFG